MKKTVVIDVVALSSSVIGEHTPFLSDYIKRKHLSRIEPVFPALTTSAQSTYVTGKWPSKTGIVGNGWYDRTDCEVKFWKQSNKLVQVKPSDNWDAFWHILEMNLTQKYHKRPTHSLEDFNRLQSLLPEGMVKLFAAYQENNMIAGIVVFLANKKCLHAQYIASDSNYQHLRPLNAIIDYIVNWGVTERFTYLNLGTSNEQQGRLLNEGLFRFKEGFGAKGILREVMHLTVSNAALSHSHL
jgi:hypothetical protein